MAAIIAAFSACGKKEKEASVDIPETPAPTVLVTPEPTVKPTETPKPTPSPSPTPKPTPSPTPEPTKSPYINLLTGEELQNAELSARRPIAIVINNVKEALPQNGIAQASLYYEILSEGNITRIIALFQDFDAAKIGSIRSARDYFLDFSFDHDAIFVHHGGSNLAYAAIKSQKADNIDGMKFDGTIFWRDAERQRVNGYVNSSVTSAANIFTQIENYGYRLNKADGYEGMFAFYDAPSNVKNAERSENVTVNYISSTKAGFIYDRETKKYAKFWNGKDQIDVETGEQLRVTNVLVQLANMYEIPGDTADRRAAELIGSGTGFLATNGTYTPVKWKKNSLKEPTVWTHEDGTPLTLNVGKTWISVAPLNAKITFE